ncbi:MAG TPA: DUF4157 domain-containing protein [Rhizomicrobium sp.]|jgi:hypothetical protein
MFASEKLPINAASSPAFAALPNARELAGQGRPLAQAERAGAERTYGADLSHVRLHDGPSARHSADAMGARGWSWGEHVVLGSQPGPRTLDHELAHVAQQREAPKDDTLRPGAKDGALEHDADAAAASGRPPALKAGSRTVQLDDKDKKKDTAPPAKNNSTPAKTDPAKADAAPPQYGYKPPPLHLGPTYDFSLHLTAMDRGKIDSYLDSHAFKLMQLKPSLDGAIVTVDEMVDRLKPLLPVIDRGEIERYLSGKVSGMVNDVLLHPRLSPAASPGPVIPDSFLLPLSPPSPSLPGPRTTPDKVQGWQTVIGTGVQLGWHVNAVTGKPANPAQDTTLQFSVARNFAAHPENKSGSEVQGLVQFGYNVNTKQVTPMAGVQFTEVFAPLDGMVQVGGFAQVLAGVAAGGGSIAGQIQPSIGAQAMVQVGKLQLGVQGGVGSTISSSPTVDKSVTGVAQWSF